jgi:hypothetical protein
VITTNITTSQAQDLASTFVKWFYEMINGSSTSSVNLSCSSSSSCAVNTANADSVKAADEFRPDHFFSDADAKISLQPSPGDVNSQPGTAHVFNCQFHFFLQCFSFPFPELISVSKCGREVHSVLSGIVRKYGLTYNPNLCGDGVRGIIDPHGLVLVTACGTLHNAASVCGTFHQQFGLVRDPFDGNNWKIKFTNASLVSTSVVSELPRLGEDAGVGQQQEIEQQHQGGGSAGSTAMALS